MEILLNFVQFFLHIEEHLVVLVHNYGTLVYAVIALIVFSEVGLVVTPFLPGDSMLFAVGTLCATGIMDLKLVLILFPIAAIAGDNFNRLMGLWFGHKMFSGKDRFIFNQKNLKKARDFYEKYGPRAVTLCRFIPFFRTYVPFVAGMTEMRWRTFFPYSILGGAGWVLFCTMGGFFLGNIPVIKHHFELVIVAVIAVSVVPAIVEFFKSRHAKSVA